MSAVSNCDTPTYTPRNTEDCQETRRDIFYIISDLYTDEIWGSRKFFKRILLFASFFSSKFKRVNQDYFDKVFVQRGMSKKQHDWLNGTYGAQIKCETIG